MGFQTKTRDLKEDCLLLMLRIRRPFVVIGLFPVLVDADLLLTAVHHSVTELDF